MEKPILDPAIPYIGPIYGGKFGPGKIIRIRGITPAIAYRFDINLQCGPATSPRDDVALQISVRILDGYVTLNSLHNGIWAEEQRGTTCPIKRAENFEIILMCDSNRYKVAINGQQYSEFSQKIHYDRVTHLAIEGDVSIIQISYEPTVGDGLGAGSASGLGAGLQPTVPFSAPFIDSQTDDDFEVIDSTTSTAPPPGMHPPPALGFSQPPSYESALYKGGPTSQPVNAGGPRATSAPYLVNSPYPTAGAPYPTAGVPYPAGAGVSPYSANGVVGTPIGFQGATGTSPYPPSGAPGLPPPPPGAPVPLNVATSNFRTAPRYNNRQKCCVIVCGIIFGVIIFVVIVVIKINKNKLRSRQVSDNYYSSHDNY